MMDEISSHIMDIVANSVSAKAKNIIVVITKDTKKSLLTLRIRDDGIGMDEDMVEKVQDPFFSTKIGKKVGLGIPLLKGTAETTEGSFRLTSKLGEGTEIFASFNVNHPDLPPMGRLKDTIFVIVAGNPEIDFQFQIINDGKEFILDTTEIRTLLDGVPINHPEVLTFLSKYLDENM